MFLKFGRDFFSSLRAPVLRSYMLGHMVISFKDGPSRR